MQKIAEKLFPDKLANLPLTEHTHEDSYLMEQTRECGYHLRNAARTLDVTDVQHSCDISVGALLKLLRGFKELRLTSTGKLDIQGFFEAASLEDSGYSRHLFTFLDIERLELVSFGDFVQRLTVIKNKQALRLRMQLVYLLCNSSGSGQLTLEEMDAACDLVMLTSDKKASCMQALKGNTTVEGGVSFEVFALVLDRNRELLNWFLLSPSNPLLKLVKWHN